MKMARTGYLKRLLHRVRTKSNKMSIQSGDIFEHGDVSTSKNSFVEPQDFDPDGNVFHLMVSLTLMFMVLYVFGASVPYWYIMREPVNNITSCESAELYVTNMAEQLTHVTKDTQISVSSSLWFLRIQIGDRGSTKISRMFPFISLPHISLPARGMYNTNVFQIKARLVSPRPYTPLPYA